MDSEDLTTAMSNKVSLSPLLVTMVAIATCAAMFLFAHSAKDAFLMIDSLDYLKIGRLIFAEGVYESYFRTPVFPVFLGFWVEFLGLSIAQYVWVQYAFVLINLGLLFVLCRNFLDRQLSLVICLALALDLVTIQVASWVLSETLFSFLLLVSLNFFAALLLKFPGSLLLAVVTGLALGLFALCRPVGQFLPYLLATWFLFEVWRTRSIKLTRAFLVMLCMLLTGAAVMESWKQFNQQRTGHRFVSQTFMINLYNWRGAWNIAYRDGRAFEDVKMESFQQRAEWRRENFPKGANVYDEYVHFREKGLDIILSTPKETFFQAVRGAVFLYAGIYNGSLDRIFADSRMRIPAKLYSLLYLLLLYLGIVLLVLRWRSISQAEQKLIIMATIIVGYFTLLSIGVESYARLRAPFMPYLVILSVIGWSKWRASSTSMAHKGEQH